MRTLAIVSIIVASIASTASAATLHLVIIADTLDPSIGKSVAVDRKMIETAFMDYMPVPGSLRVSAIEGDRCRREVILTTVAGLAVGPDDAVVVFYSGHGAYDPRVGQYLQFPRVGGYLTREELTRAIKAKGARLGVLSTDCCNKASALPAGPAAPTARFPSEPDNPPRTKALFRALFFDVTGFVDLTSSKQGEASIGYPGLVNNNGDAYFGLGGLWTTGLVWTLRGSYDHVRTWPDVAAESAKVADSSFRRLAPDGIDNPDDPARPQMTQTAVINVAVRPIRATRPDPPGPDAGQSRYRPDVPSDLLQMPVRLGIHGFENKGDGITVWATQPGSPASRLGLKRGDVVLAIGENPVRTATGYHRAVLNAPGAVRLSVRDSASGAIRTADVTLDEGQWRVRPSETPAGRAAFGAATTAVEGGLRIDGVAPESPSALAGLDPGDTILAINDRPVTTVDAYFKAVADSPDEMCLTVRDIKTGQLLGMVVTLDRPSLNRLPTVRGPGNRTLQPRPSVGTTQVRGRPSLGVHAYENGGKGLAVWATRPGGPAARIGLERGDVILAVDGRAIATVGDYAEALALAKVELSLRVRNVRDGSIIESRVATESRPSSDATGSRFGAFVTAVGDGLRVDRFLAGSASEACGLDPGDVVTAINGRPVRDLDSFNRAVRESPYEMTYTVRNIKTGQIQGMVAALDR